MHHAYTCMHAWHIDKRCAKSHFVSKVVAYDQGVDSHDLFSVNQQMLIVGHEVLHKHGNIDLLLLQAAGKDVEVSVQQGRWITTTENFLLFFFG